MEIAGAVTTSGNFAGVPSARTALELVEQKIVKRQSDLCLRKLTEEELLLFLFLIGYRWKREQKKVFSKRNICWALGLSDQPHPEIVCLLYTSDAADE